MKKMYEKPEVFSEGAFETLGSTGCTWLDDSTGDCNPTFGGTNLALPSA